MTEPEKATPQAGVAESIRTSWRLRSYLLPYLPAVMGLLLLALLQADFFLTGTTAARRLINAFTAQGVTSIPSEAPKISATGYIFNLLAADGSVVRLALLMALFVMLARATSIVAEQVTVGVSHRFHQRLQKNVAAALSWETGISRSERLGGATSQIFLEDTRGLSNLLFAGIVSALQAILTAGIYAYGISRLPSGPQLLLVAIPLLLLLQLVVGLLLARESGAEEKSQVLSMQLRRRTTGFFDALSRLVYFRGDQSEREKLIDLSRGADDALRRLQRVNATRATLSGLFADLTLPLAAVVIVLAPVVFAGIGPEQSVSLADPGALVQASLLLLQLSSSIGVLINAGSVLTDYSPNVRRLEAALNIPEPEAKPDELTALRRMLEPPSIAFRNVTFAYPNTAAPLLHDLSFEIPPGARVGLIGRAGTGKSTIARLLIGDLRPLSGQILFDGIDIADWHLWWRRELIGLLPAESGFLHGTPEENVVFGRDRASVPNLEWALEASGVAAMAEQWDGGMQRLLTDPYSELAGGQRRRIALARLLAGDQRAWVLDEPGPQLDPRSMKGRTSIIITHDPHVFATDSNLFLQNGQIVDQGTHEELKRRNPDYSQLVLA